MGGFLRSGTARGGALFVCLAVIGLALFAVGVTAVDVWAQSADPSVLDPTADPLALLTGGLSSVAGIVGLTMLLTAAAKRYIGNVPILEAVPVWVYVLLISVGLTVVARQWLGTLEGDLWSLIKSAVVMAAAASGFREWWAARTKPLGDTSAAVAADTRRGGRP